ncbi:hypothetical protein JNW89_32155 [Micromonospora sp. 4G55]|nr:hypothetical protein [Micromonospora sp. 4G55]
MLCQNTHFLGLALPKNLSENEIKALQKGFLKTARKFNIKIIGGDTISNDKIDISLTIISKINDKAVFRKRFKKRGIYLLIREN